MTDYSKASGAQLSQGIYNAFRRLGYTDFGAKTMLAEIRREHGGEFSPEGGSRRPFGFEREPANANQINFGLINSTGPRTKEILGFLGEKGLVSNDGERTSINPTGIKVENSQRTLDALAEWHDQDMRTKGARDPNAIISGADPRQLPDKFRDPNYADVHDAHRGTAAYIQWQHPEIYGGRYRHGIAGQRHYDRMIADRAALDRLIDQNAEPGTVVASAQVPKTAFDMYGEDANAKPQPAPVTAVPVATRVPTGEPAAEIGGPLDSLLSTLFPQQPEGGDQMQAMARRVAALEQEKNQPQPVQMKGGVEIAAVPMKPLDLTKLRQMLANRRPLGTGAV
jgi:hypothetical protein